MARAMLTATHRPKTNQGPKPFAFENSISEMRVSVVELLFDENTPVLSFESRMSVESGRNKLALLDCKIPIPIPARAEAKMGSLMMLRLRVGVMLRLRVRVRLRLRLRLLSF